VSLLILCSPDYSGIDVSNSFILGATRIGFLKMCLLYKGVLDKLLIDSCLKVNGMITKVISLYKKHMISAEMAKKRKTTSKLDYSQSGYIIGLSSVDFFLM